MALPRECKSTVAHGGTWGPASLLLPGLQPGGGGTRYPRPDLAPSAEGGGQNCSSSGLSLAQGPGGHPAHGALGLCSGLRPSLRLRTLGFRDVRTPRCHLINTISEDGQTSWCWGATLNVEP